LCSGVCVFPQFEIRNPHYALRNTRKKGLVEVEEGLGFDYGHLFGISGEGVDVQLVRLGFEIDIAERLKAGAFEFRKFDEDASCPCETFEVCLALHIETCRHFFDLKVGHIAYAFAQGAFVGFWAFELKTLNQAARGQKLIGNADNLA
jgi:hypothetical protein